MVLILLFCLFRVQEAANRNNCQGNDCHVSGAAFRHPHRSGPGKPDRRAEPDAIYMRKDHDFRPDVEIKREWVEKLREEGHNIILAFEDRDRVVKMYRDLGIQCCQVAEGTY